MLALWEQPSRHVLIFRTLTWLIVHMQPVVICSYKCRSVTFPLLKQVGLTFPWEALGQQQSVFSLGRPSLRSMRRYGHQKPGRAFLPWKTCTRRNVIR